MANVFAFCVDMASSSTSTAKRKRVVLTVEDKLTVCDLVEKKVPYTEIMNRFNIGKSTISDIVKNKETDDGEESGEENLVLEDWNSSICPVSHVEAMQMFDGCLTWLRAQPEASVENTSTLVMLRELAAQKQEASRKQSDIRFF